MDCILCFIKKHRVATVLICIVVFALPLLIVHILFKWNSDNPWLAAEWSAGDVLGYIAGFESLIGTIALGIVTVYQSNKANEANERLAKENNHQYSTLAANTEGRQFGYQKCYSYTVRFPRREGLYIERVSINHSRII